MYEIWMMLNIGWELVLEFWPWLAAAAAAWILLMARAASRGGWRASLPAALLIAVAVAALAFFMAPGWIHSSFADLRYWVDWMALIGLAAGCGAVALAFAWPALAGFRPRRQHGLVG